jgi:hypothetical protein
MTPDADTCITCGDVAVVGRVVELGPHGERLLCHAGIALQRVGE